MLVAYILQSLIIEKNFSMVLSKFVDKFTKYMFEGNSKRMKTISKKEILNDVSIIIPIHNGSQWIDACLNSVMKQTALNVIKFEICVCNDASNDNTNDLLINWKRKLFEECGIILSIYQNDTLTPNGVGYAKNMAVSISNGCYLCFQDVDDVMLPDRILSQYRKALEMPTNTLIGSQFERLPKDSTVRYTKWANNLTQEQLTLQVYTSHGPTIIMPTWFCHRSVFEKVGGFSENGKGTPEDLLFFYKHLDIGGQVYRIDNVLLQYFYHINAATVSVHENTIWNIRMDRIQRVVLSNWDKFTIWNAGKQGRKFYNSLSKDNRKKVIAFCDVDLKKVCKTYVPFDPTTRKEGNPVNIVHVKEAKPPLVICVKLDMTQGKFEEYLHCRNIKEGEDYVLFS